MSSTLFARGVNSQVGMKRRADDMNKNIAGIKNDIVLIKQTSDEIVSLKAVIITLTEKVASLQKTVDTLVASSATMSGVPSMTIQNAS